MSMSLSDRLRMIADASLRVDGTDIPLGEELRRAATEIDRLRAELAAAEARGIAARLEQPLTITENLLAQARAEGIAVGRKEEREEIAAWHEAQEKECKANAKFYQEGCRNGRQSPTAARFQGLAYNHSASAAAIRSLPHAPIKGDEGRGG